MSDKKKACFADDLSMMLAKNHNNDDRLVMQFMFPSGSLFSVTFALSPCLGGTGCVLMVYGLNAEKMNCERIFNLFCLYGNVVKVITDAMITQLVE